MEGAGQGPQAPLVDQQPNEVLAAPDNPGALAGPAMPQPGPLHGPNGPQPVKPDRRPEKKKRKLDAKPLVLFDLNGVLVSERDTGERFRATWKMRPGIERLLQLRDRYQLGVFSSAKEHTVTRALAQVHEHLATATQVLEGASGGPLEVATVFHPVFCRDHCKEDPTWRKRKGGKSWDTVKPLRANGLPLSSVLLVDNELRKAVASEHENILLLPTWEQCPDQGVATWQCLIDCLIALPASGTPDQGLDLRRHTQDINAAIKAAAGSVKGTQPTRVGPGSCDGHMMPQLNGSHSENNGPSAGDNDQQDRQPLQRAGSVEDWEYGDYVMDASSNGEEGVMDDDAGDDWDGVDVAGMYTGSDSSEEEEDIGDGPQWTSFSVDTYPQASASGPRALGPGSAPLYAGPPKPPASSGPAAPPVPEQELSALHYEVAAFAAACAPSEEFMRLVGLAVAEVQAAAVAIWPNARAVLFGSQASGLALPGSDVDIVVLGVGEGPDTHTTNDLHAQSRGAVKALQRLGREMRDRHVFTSFELIKAKVPIIKARMSPPGPQPVRRDARRAAQLSLDISVGASSGVGAVALAQQCVLAMPPLRPLVLVLKALLRAAGLNEVFTGGMSSYTILNMVTAHLQCDGFAEQAAGALKAGLELQNQHLELPSQTAQQQGGRMSPSMPGQANQGPGTDSTPSRRHKQQRLDAQPQANGAGSEGQQGAGTAAPPSTVHNGGGTEHVEGRAGSRSSGCGEAAAVHGLQPAFLNTVRESASQPWQQAGGGWDLGDLLAALLARFGYVLDDRREGVSVRRGGVCGGAASIHRRHEGLLVVEDPQQAQRNLCGGSYGWPAIRLLLRCALQRLLARGPLEDPCLGLPPLLPLPRKKSKTKGNASTKGGRMKQQQAPEGWAPVDTVSDMGRMLQSTCGQFPQLGPKRLRGSGMQKSEATAKLQAVHAWEHWLVGTGRRDDPPPPLIRASQGHVHLHAVRDPEQPMAGPEMTEAEQWASVQQEGVHRSPASHGQQSNTAKRKRHLINANGRVIQPPSAEPAPALAWATQLPNLFNVQQALSGPSAVCTQEPLLNQMEDRAGSKGLGKSGRAGPGLPVEAGVRGAKDSGGRLNARQLKIIAAQERRKLANQQSRVDQLLENAARASKAAEEGGQGHEAADHPSQQQEPAQQEQPQPLSRKQKQRLKSEARAAAGLATAGLEVSPGPPGATALDIGEFFTTSLGRRHQLAARALGWRKTDAQLVADGAAGTAEAVEMLALEQWLDDRGHDRHAVRTTLELEQHRLAYRTTMGGLTKAQRAQFRQARAQGADPGQAANPRQAANARQAANPGAPAGNPAGNQPANGVPPGGSNAQAVRLSRREKKERRKGIGKGRGQDRGSGGGKGSDREPPQSPGGKGGRGGWVMG